MMLIYGGGGHGCVVYEALQAAGVMCRGVFDDDLTALAFDAPLLGPYDPQLFPELPLLLAVGDNARRRQLAQIIRHAAGAARHATAWVAPSAKIENGAMLMAQSVIQSRAHVGAHVIVNTGAIVEHDAHVAAFVHLAPRATLCGEVRIGDGTFIGPGAVITRGVRIGRWSVVAAGAVVLEDLPANVLAVGAPARIIRNLLSDE